jgi:hypothetical protein
MEQPSASPFLLDKCWLSQKSEGENFSGLLSPGSLESLELLNGNNGNSLGVSAVGIVGTSGNFAAASPVANVVVRPSVDLCSSGDGMSGWVMFVKGFLTKDD